MTNEKENLTTEEKEEVDLRIGWLPIILVGISTLFSVVSMINAIGIFSKLKNADVSPDGKQIIFKSPVISNKPIIDDAPKSLGGGTTGQYVVYADPSNKKDKGNDWNTTTNLSEAIGQISAEGKVTKL